jgi:hypothetical protein
MSIDVLQTKQDVTTLTILSTKDSQRKSTKAPESKVRERDPLYKMKFLAVLLVVCGCVSAAPSWSFGAGTNAVVNVYPSGFLDHLDCFVSSCDHDVSIVQDADPVFGPCAINCTLSCGRGRILGDYFLRKRILSVF